MVKRSKRSLSVRARIALLRLSAPLVALWGLLDAGAGLPLAAPHRHYRPSTRATRAHAIRTQNHARAVPRAWQTHAARQARSSTHFLRRQLGLKRGKEHMAPVKGSRHAHSVFARNKQTGRITSYHTYRMSKGGWHPKKMVHMVGQAHRGVATPHTHRWKNGRWQAPHSSRRHEVPHYRKR